MALSTKGDLRPCRAQQENRAGFPRAALRLPGLCYTTPLGLGRGGSCRLGARGASRVFDRAGHPATPEAARGNASSRSRRRSRGRELRRSRPVYLHRERRLSEAGPLEPIWFEDSKAENVRDFLLHRTTRGYLLALERTAGVIDGFESPLGMELLGTVGWLLDQENSFSRPSCRLKAVLRLTEGGASVGCGTALSGGREESRSARSVTHLRTRE